MIPVHHDIQVIEDFLPKSYQDEIENLLLSKKFPWFYLSNLSYDDNEFTSSWTRNDSRLKDSEGFTHIFKDDEGISSPYFEFFKPLVYFIELKTGYPVSNLYRLRSVMTCKDTSFTENTFNLPHVDLKHPHKTLVYYVNDSSGDTILFKEHWNGRLDFSKKEIVKRVSPKKGRAVIFDGFRYHTGSAPTNNPRVLINLNFD